jgi:raffinose/stachyose/melibiose transport system substrate-binding protein
MMKKSLLKVSLFLIVSCVLYAGGTSDQTASKGDKRTNITVLMRSSGTDSTWNVWHTAFEEFAAQKGLKTEYEAIAHDADYVNKLQLYISSNQLPDFYGCANGTFSKAAKAIGGLVCIEDAPKEIDKFSLMNKAVVDFLRDADDQKMWLFPMSLNCEFFYYRKDIFAKYNLQPPKKWDEFLAICKILKDNEETPVITGGQANWQLMRYLSFPAWRATHDKFIYGYLNGSDSFGKNKAAQAGVELVSTMGKSGYFQRGFTSTDYTSGVNGFYCA